MNIHIKYPRAKPYFSDTDKSDILRNISEILDSGMLTQGAYVAKFESEFSNVIGTKYAIATSSCTSALEIAIRSLGIVNKKILVTTNTWMSCANAILLTGNIPVFVDIDPDTLCMSTSKVLEKIDSVDAILWVHMAGLISPDFINIVDICKQRGIFIIEDCAHAHGASLNNRLAGSIGDVGCFSFYPTKIMATGEGGMITTNNDQLAEKARIYRNHGTVRNTENIIGLDYGVTCHYPSQNFRMTEIAGILGLYQLKHLTDFVSQRNRIADSYRIYLNDIDGIKLLPKYNGHSYWNFYIVLDDSINREQFAKTLLYEYGIQTANAYDPACHKQTMYAEYIDDTFPVADDVLTRHISLPMYVTLTDHDIEYITNCIKDAVNQNK
jgi:dTDP-4-amino-4,6-dideoxygalactose transaminase